MIVLRRNTCLIDMETTHRYFAYGSNMLLARIRERVPGAHPIGAAQLKAHVLRWHKVGMDQSGKCDLLISDDAEQCVYGVLYDIPSSQKSALDLAEDLGRGYEEKRLMVQCEAGSVEAFAYVAL